MDITVVMGLVIIVVIGVLVKQSRDKTKVYQRHQQAMRHAQLEYQQALSALQVNNTSANRVKALELGRRYASLCRDGGLVGVFDEVALQNDLKAYAGD